MPPMAIDGHCCPAMALPPSSLYKTDPRAPVTPLHPLEPPHPLVTSTCVATREARAVTPVFYRRRFRPSPFLLLAGESFIVTPFLSSTQCATHPSPLMPRSPAIWLTRAPSPVAPLQNLAISVRLLRWWACPCDPLDLLSPFLISPKALAVRNPTDLIRPGASSCAGGASVCPWTGGWRRYGGFVF
jgi:hypothetical protein